MAKKKEPPAEYVERGGADVTDSGNATLRGGGFEEESARTEPGVLRGWHSRGYMPHLDSHEVVQHVTFHLADSMPA